METDAATGGGRGADRGGIERLRSRFRIQWVFMSAVLLLVAFTMSLSAWLDYVSIGRRETERLSTQASVVEKSVRRQLEAVDSALRTVAREIPEKVDAYAARELHERFASLISAMPGVRTLLVTDREGTALASNRTEIVGMNFSSRNYFTTPIGRRDPSLVYVSPPFRTVLGAYVINLTRIVSGPGGEFRGVVSASLDPEFFGMIMSSVLYSSDGWSVMAQSDGLAFISVPAGPYHPPGPPLGVESFISAHLGRGEVATVYTEGTPQCHDDVVAVRTIGDAGVKFDKHFVIGIGRHRPEIYADWSKMVFAKALLYALLVVCVTPGLAVYQKRQKGYEAKLIEDEAELRALSEELDRFFTLSLDLLCIADVGGHFRRLNRAWEQTLGYKVEDILGRNFLDLVHPDDAEATLRAMKELTGGERIVGFVNRYRATDGSYRWIEWHSTMYGESLIYAVARDVTERKATEEERELLIAQLKDALASVKQLSGLLPICASCKKIRDDKGYWKQLEVYITERSEATFTHSLCQECAKNLYPEYFDKKG